MFALKCEHVRFQSDRNVPRP